MNNIQRFKKISDYHKLAHLEAPQHPLISLIDYSEIAYPPHVDLSWVQDYYTIGLKRNIKYKLFYGQQSYDFDEGVMTFIAPQQVMRLRENPNLNSPPTGWLLLIHPDFHWNTTLSKKIKDYAFFGYSVNEALHLSSKEEQLMLDILKNIEREYQANIDKFSQKIIISQLELLLNYAERFYERQFLTRNKVNHQLLSKLELALDNYFNNNIATTQGLPTVVWLANELNLSPNYLSSLLKSLTGQSTQQHIHEKLISKAKELLSTSHLSVSEIAYTLGFEQPSSFTKLFKNKTTTTPMTFRKSHLSS